MSKQLGLLLIREKLITREQLDEANSGMTTNGKNLVFQLLDRQVLDAETLFHFISDKMAIPAADADSLCNIKPQVARLLARDLADEFSVIPMEVPDSKTIQLAMIDPTDAAAIQELSFFTGKRIRPVVASRSAVHAALKQFYAVDRGDVVVTPKKRPVATPAPPTTPVPHAPLDKPMPKSSVTAAEPVPTSENKNSISALDLNDAFAPVAEALAAPRKVASNSESASRQPPQPRPWSTRPPPSKQEIWPTETLPPVSSINSNHIDSHTDPVNILPAVIAPPPPAVTFSPPRSPIPLPATPGMPTVPLDVVHKQTLVLLDQVSDKEEVAQHFLNFAAHILKRVALFTIKKNVLLGWQGHGEDFTKRNLKGIMIPLNSPSIFQRVKETKVYYLGDVPRTTVNQIFLTALGNVYPPNVLVIPLLVRDKVVCVFYGDHMLEPIPTANLHYLHLLTPKIENVFEKLILQAKKPRL